MFLEELKCAVKKKNMINSVNEVLNLDESDDEFDDDKSNESDED